MTTHHVPDFTAPAAGDLTSVEVDGRTIAVTVVDGEPYAFDDTCTHAQASLSGGEVEDGAVVCPLHSAAFDIATGEVRTGPAKTALRCYRATLTTEGLTLELPDADAPTAGFAG